MTRLWLDERAGGPALLQAVRGRDRHQRSTYVRASDTALFSKDLGSSTARASAPGTSSVTTPVKPAAEEVLLQSSRTSLECDPAGARSHKRWYGVYANTYTPAYNTTWSRKRTCQDPTRISLTRKEWVGRVAIDKGDIRVAERDLRALWRAARTQARAGPCHYLKPILTEGHLLLARSSGAGEYAVCLEQLYEPHAQREACGRADRTTGR